MDEDKQIVVSSERRNTNFNFGKSHDGGKGIDLSFKDLSYIVKIKRNKVYEDKVILNKISGYAKQGQTLAIMGASGAGKTSLLNILSMKIGNSTRARYEGEIHANGTPYGQDFGKFAAYVMQNDILMGTLTPEEALSFAASLRLKGSEEEKKGIVRNLIQQLKIERCSKTYIGDTLGQFKGISGGERKRTSIGVELITNPTVLFLDEPTSGLDSFTSWVIINLLHKLAKDANKTIVFTIHQPNSDTFNLFDRLMLLVEGKFVYQGPSKGAISHFGGLGYQCPNHSNPPDYFMNIMSYHGTDVAADQKRFQTFFEAYDQKMLPEVNQTISQLSTESRSGIESTHTGFFYQLSLISGRSFKNFTRNPMLLKSRIAQTVIVCFIISSMYFQLAPPDNQTDLMNRVGALFFVCVNQFMTSMFPVILTFPEERGLFLKEVGARQYNVSPYFFGKSMVEIPLVISTSIILVAVMYYIIGFNPEADKYFIMMLVILLLSFSGNSLGLFVSCAFSDAKVANAVAPLFIIPFMLFGGFFLNNGDTPSWLTWVTWISPFRYGLESLCWNEFDGANVGVLDQLGFSFGKWQSIGCLAAIGVVARFLALVFLKALVTRIQ